MAKIQLVKKIDYDLALKTVFVSCTNKDGLLSNIDSNDCAIHGLPENGLIGYLMAKIPRLKIIATGGTYAHLKNHQIPVTEISEITNYPEMESGLVKSLHPVIHAGLLAHRHTESDHEFMVSQKIDYIDALIVNFYPLDDAMNDDEATIEFIRQNVDVGGPSMTHNARKAYISTAVITDPENYGVVVSEMESNEGLISIGCRLDLAKKASTMITDYMLSVNRYFQSITKEQILREYEDSKE